jgi:hypothetical protein
VTLRNPTLYTLQVSNHAGAGERIPTQEASESWETMYFGPIASEQEAREATDNLAKFYRHARAFRGVKTLGRLWYAHLDMRGPGSAMP